MPCEGEHLCMGITERFRRVTVKRNVTPVHGGKIMQGSKEQGSSYGEGLFKPSCMPQRKLQ